jgi:hypothetical protein
MREFIHSSLTFREQLTKHRSSIGVFLEQQEGIGRLFVSDAPGKVSAPFHDKVDVSCCVVWYKYINVSFFYYFIERVELPNYMYKCVSTIIRPSCTMS